MGPLYAFVPDVAELTMPPAPRLSTLNGPPAMAYPEPLNVMELKSVPLAKLLKFPRWLALNGKTRSSPGSGATWPNQLPGSDQSLVPPLPTHVTVEGTTRSSSTSSRGRNTGARRGVRLLTG